MQSYCFIFFVTLVTIWNYLPYLFTCLLPRPILTRMEAAESVASSILFTIVSPVPIIVPRPYDLFSTRAVGQDDWSVRGWIINSMDGEDRLHTSPRKHGSQCWPLCSVWYSPTPASPAWVPVLSLLEYLPLSHWLPEGRNQVSLTYLYVPGAEGIWWPAEWVSTCLLLLAQALEHIRSVGASPLPIGRSIMTDF